MRINIYFIIAILYFFFNSFLLPLGLLYTTILTPAFYLWIKLKYRSRVITKFILVLIPFIIAHLLSDIVLKDYLISLSLYLTVYIFIYSLYLFLKTRNYLNLWFEKITLINFALTIIAILSLLTPIREMWALHPVSSNINNLRRLELFTYEPSYYSTLLVPLIFYYVLCTVFYKNLKHVKLLFMLLIPLCLSFSLGVIASVIIACVIGVLLNIHRIRIKSNHLKAIKFLFISLLIAAVLILIFYPYNPLYHRIYNIFTGSDSSGRGRTFEAIEIALILLKQQDMWIWGIGLGQIKTQGYEVIINYYNYPRDIVTTVAIPNAFAETLAIFGFLGATLRILLQLFLYFKTKVYNNYFQTLCFVYIFIYQFTGSYITNIAEYVIWLFAFIPYFKEFDINKLSKTINLSKDQ